MAHTNLKEEVVEQLQLISPRSPQSSPQCDDSADYTTYLSANAVYQYDGIDLDTSARVTCTTSESDPRAAPAAATVELYTDAPSSSPQKCNAFDSDLDAEFEYNDYQMEDISKIEAEEEEEDRAYFDELQKTIEHGRQQEAQRNQVKTPLFPPGLGFENVLGLGLVGGGMARAEEGKEEEVREEEKECKLRFQYFGLSGGDAALYNHRYLGAYRCKSQSRLRQCYTRVEEDAEDVVEVVKVEEDEVEEWDPYSP